MHRSLSSLESVRIQRDQPNAANPKTIGGMVSVSRWQGHNLDGAQVRKMLRDGRLYACNVDGDPDPKGKYLGNPDWLEDEAA